MSHYTRDDLEFDQIEIIEEMKEKMFCGAFLPMSWGKTVITLTAISDLLDEFKVSKILIVAPKRVANRVWKQEAQKWEHLKHLKISICTGSQEEKVAGFKTKADIHVTNFDALPFLISNFKFKWDMLVIDESSGFKNYKTARFKAVKKIQHKLNGLVLLSGTPNPEGLLDLWPQVWLLDRGKRLGRTISSFRKKYFDANPYSYAYELKEKSFDEIMEKVSDICFTRDKKDNTPGQVKLFEKITLPPKLRKQYKELEKEFVLTLDNGEILEADNSASLSNKLLQFCNGFVYEKYIEDEKIKRRVHYLHDEKISVLKEIVEDNPDENFLVAYSFIPDKERLLKAFPHAELLTDDPEQQIRWDNKEIKMCITHPASSAHGLNLQLGGSILVWFGSTWSLELYLQLNMRLDRPGQTELVRIIHIIVEDSIEEKLVEAVNIKGINQEQVLQYLRNQYL